MALNPARSWSAQFAREWWPYMEPTSVLRWRNRTIRATRGVLSPDDSVVLRFRRPFRADVAVRACGSDPYTVREVIVEQVYSGLKDRIPGARKIIDLGANIGLASLYFASIFPESRILAVEPLQRNVDLLYRNLGSLMRENRVSVLQAAAWSSAAELEFGMPNEGAYDSAAVSQTAVRSMCTEVVKVHGMPMADILEFSGFDQVDLVKIDIEGAEVELFTGPAEWLSRVRAIAVEFHGEARQNCGFDALMARYGFAVRNADSHTVIAVRP